MLHPVAGDRFERQFELTPELTPEFLEAQLVLKIKIWNLPDAFSWQLDRAIEGELRPLLFAIELHRRSEPVRPKYNSITLERLSLQ